MAQKYPLVFLGLIPLGKIVGHEHDNCRHGVPECIEDFIGSASPAVDGFPIETETEETTG